MSYKKYSNHKLCYECYEIVEEDTLNFTIEGRNLDDKNTIFDGDNFIIQVCKTCADKLGLKPEWFDNELDYDYSKDRYRHELDILRIIEGFKLEAQEYIYNSENIFTDSTVIFRDDWITLNA